MSTFTYNYEPLAEIDKAQMDSLVDAVFGAIEGKPSPLVLSVLAQLFYGSIPDEQLDEATALNRMKAMLSILNIFRDGYAQTPMATESLARMIESLVAIVRCGSIKIAGPALAYTLVTTVCNGRRNQDAEQEAIRKIAATVSKLEAVLNAS